MRGAGLTDKEHDLLKAIAQSQLVILEILQIDNKEAATPQNVGQRLRLAGKIGAAQATLEGALR